MSELTRRGFLRGTVAAGIGAAIAGGCATGSGESRPAIARSGGLRVAHLTDMHVTHERGSPEGYAQALRSLDAHKPAFIITGGDHVMDASGQEKRQAVAWYDIYERVMAENTKLPVYPCIGNHDVYGWTTKAASASDPDFGKAMALDRLKLKSRFYSFDRGGWHFIVLDNIMRREPLYYGELDGEQREWLDGDLKANKLPAVVVTHIPLLSMSAAFDGGRTPEGEARTYNLTDGNMHHNVRPLLKVLAANNVKVCLSGHIHQVDRVDYLGITFFCSGAVSGNWWSGPHLEFPEGHGIVDFYPDGTFENKYVTFGWKARA